MTVSEDVLLQLSDLRKRRDGGEELPGLQEALQAAGASLIGADLRGLDLTGANFSAAELSGADFSGSRLLGANFNDSSLFEAKLCGAELLGAQLRRANLSSATAERAGFGNCALTSANLFDADLSAATFSGADLSGADLRVARLDGARLIQADLRDTDFSGASLREADLTECKVDSAVLHNVDLRVSRLRGIKDYASADWAGADIRDVDFAGAWLLRRHVLDANYIAEFRSQSDVHEWLYRLWWVTSDCGRSLGRWTLWCVLLVAVFSGIYTQVSIDYGEHETWLSPIYYSVVTFTTLGYGDVLPASVAGQVVAMTQVVLGYLALGGLLAILSDKLARRAG